MIDIPAPITASLEFWHQFVNHPDVNKDGRFIQISDMPKILADNAMTVIDADNDDGFAIVQVNKLVIYGGDEDEHQPVD